MKKVLLGMSGGVDSSVSAYLLLKNGYSVDGVTFNLTGDLANQAIKDAKNVALKLGINHSVLDMQKEFNKNVIDYFVGEYKSGRTPNPCVMCNKKIKFGLFLDYALKNGYDYIATGHYANIVYDEKMDRYLLKKNNTNKDQSYFLYGLNQHQLSHALFPLGDYEKPEIRKIAKEIGLPVFEKSESQDICFIKDISHGEFIKKYTRSEFKKGNFVNREGKILGTHSGIVNYTVGQRKGLGVALGEPVYVTRIDAENNSVILGDLSLGFTQEITAEDTNFILFDSLESEMEVLAKIRYRSKEEPCVVIPTSKDSVKVKFKNKVKFPAPGQSVVFYLKDGTVVGGGVIC